MKKGVLLEREIMPIQLYWVEAVNQHRVPVVVRLGNCDDPKYFARDQSPEFQEIDPEQAAELRSRSSTGIGMVPVEPFVSMDSLLDYTLFKERHVHL